MKQFGKMMLLALGFGLLAVVLSSIPNHPVAASGSAPVTVVGGVTGATPVPVSLQGTGNISGNVNAAQSGAWNVGVNNFPSTQTVSGTVSVGNFPSTQDVSFNGTAQPISFSNTSSTPLFVDTDGPARNPVSAFCTATPDTITGEAKCDLLTVPSGKRLVIDSVSFAMTLPTGKAFISASLTRWSLQLDGTTVAVASALPALYKGSSLLSDSYTFAGPLPMYAEPGVVSVFANTGFSGGTGGLFASFAGHLVTP